MQWTPGTTTSRKWHSVTVEFARNRDRHRTSMVQTNEAMFAIATNWVFDMDWWRQRRGSAIGAAQGRTCTRGQWMQLTAVNCSQLNKHGYYSCML